MKKVGKIMKELGFRPEASNDVKKAFIKNLIQQANLKDPRPLETKDLHPNKEQLSLFDHKFKKSS